MVRIEGEIDIDRPVDEVFDVVADPRVEPRYNPVMLRVDELDPGPVQVGSRFRNVARAMGTSGAMELVITGIERPHRFATAARSPTMEITGEVTLEPIPGGTRLRWSWDVRPLGWFRLLTPVLVLTGRRLERRTWAHLKRYLEASGGRPAADRG